VAGAGACAALAGLVFVALSINLGRIVESPGVVGRAIETLVLLAGALVGALLALMPHLGSSLLGSMLLAVGVLTWGIPTWIQVRAFLIGDYYRARYAVQRLIFQQVATLPLMVAGLSLIGLVRGGMFWFAAALILCVVVALINAWVLLVEILR
jgi:hypothetical protein